MCLFFLSRLPLNAVPVCWVARRPLCSSRSCTCTVLFCLPFFIKEPPFPIPCSKTSTKPRIGAMTCMDRDHSASVPTIAAQTVFFSTRPTCDGQTTLYPGPGQGRSECPRPGGCSSLTHHVHYLFFFLVDRMSEPARSRASSCLCIMEMHTDRHCAKPELYSLFPSALNMETHPSALFPITSPTHNTPGYNF